MAITPYITSKSALKQYIKERLGEPVIRVEVTDLQIEHAINETVDKFIEFAEDGASLRFMTLPIIAGTQSYKLDNNVHSIRNVFNYSSAQFNAVFPERVVPDTLGIQMSEMTKNGLFSLEVTRQHLAMIDHMTKVDSIYDFNTTTKTLYFIEEPDVSETWGLLFYEKIDHSDGLSNIYDHPWVKKYATELVREQWGVSLTKYEGSQLPAGLTINAAAILQKAETSIEKLDEELETRWSLPVDFFVG